MCVACDGIVLARCRIVYLLDVENHTQYTFSQLSPHCWRAFAKGKFFLPLRLFTFISSHSLLEHDVVCWRNEKCVHNTIKFHFSLSCLPPELCRVRLLNHRFESTDNFSLLSIKNSCRFVSSPHSILQRTDMNFRNFHFPSLFVVSRRRKKSEN